MRNWLINISKKISNINTIWFIFIVSVLVRLLVINRQVFFDEAFSYFMSKMPYNFILGGNDVHPPLYYMFLKPFSIMVGNNIQLLRLSSILLWCMFFWLAYTFISERFNPQTAKYALLFMSLSPTLIYYSTELRMYMLLLVFAIINIGFYFRWLDAQNTKNTIIFAISCALLLYTHTFGALLLVFEGLYALFKKTPLKWLIFAFGLAAILCIPVFLMLYQVYTTYPSLHYAQISAKSLISTYFFMFSPPSKIVIAYSVLVLGVIALSIYQKVKPELSKNGFYYLCLLMPILLFHIGKSTGIYHHRLFLIMTIPIYIILADLTYKVQTKTTQNAEHLAIIGFYLFMFLMLFATTNFSEVYKNDNTQKILDAQNSNITTIIHQSTMTYLPFKLYFENSTKQNYLSEMPEFTFCGSIVMPNEVISQEQIDKIRQTEPVMYVNLVFDEQNTTAIGIDTKIIGGRIG